MTKKEATKINKWCGGLYQLYCEVQAGNDWWCGSEEHEKETLKLISEVREYLDKEVNTND